MPTVEVTIPRDMLHAKQREVHDHPARFKVLAAGRRWRKTSLGVIECIETGMDGKIAWWVAPSYKVAAVGWMRLKKLCGQIPGVQIREQDRMIVFPGGGWAQVRSADDPQSLRGEGLDLAVLDEYAFMKEAAWTEAIRPALADKLGRALFISTPKGHNSFYRLWALGNSGDDPDWMSWTFPTASNPHMDPREIENARKTLPEKVFEQEFLAAFVDDAGGVFRRVMDATTATLQETAFDGHQYAFGVDWGKHNDFTVITVLDLTTLEAVTIDRFNQIDYMVQVGRLKALYERFDPLVIIAESNSMGDPVIEMLGRTELGGRVEAFNTNNASKKIAIDALAMAFERGVIRIPADSVLVAELQAYEMERLPSGMLRYNAPEGMHDDCVISLALAWSAAGQTGTAADILRDEIENQETHITRNYDRIDADADFPDDDAGVTF